MPLPKPWIFWQECLDGSAGGCHIARERYISGGYNQSNIWTMAHAAAALSSGAADLTQAESIAKDMLDVRTLCLGVLHRGDTTGYEIKKMFEEGPLGHFLEASYGSIYPALMRLTDEGLVSFRDEPQKGRPDKKVYTLTDKGRAHFKKVLLEEPAEDKFRSEFLFVGLFAELLPPGHMSRLINRQIALVNQKFNMIADRMPHAQTDGARFVNGFGQALCRTAIEYLESNRAMLEQEESAQKLKSAE